MNRTVSSLQCVAARPKLAFGVETFQSRYGRDRGRVGVGCEPRVAHQLRRCRSLIRLLAHAH